MNESGEDRQNDQGILEDSMFILPQQPLPQQQQPNERAITNTVLRILRQRGIDVTIQTSQCCDNLCFNGQVKWYFFVVYLFGNYVINQKYSNFGIFWFGAYALFGGWRKRSHSQVELGNFFNFLCFLWALQTTIWGQSQPQMKFFLFLNFFALADCFLGCFIILLVLVIIIGMILVCCFCGVFTYFYRKIMKIIARHKRSQLLQQMCKNEEQNQNNEQCAICLEVGGKICRFECSHGFHKDCIMQWLQQNRTCPICRTSLY